MSKIIFTALLLCLPFQVIAGFPEVKKLLKLTPGEILVPEQKLSGEDKSPEAETYSWSIEKEGKVLKELRIEFEYQVDPKIFLPKNSKGYCLVEKPQGDVKVNDFYFFNEAATHRYQLNINKKIISILVKDMPGARTYKKCSLDKFDPKAEK
jgi:hypothetical protein